MEDKKIWDTVLKVSLVVMVTLASVSFSLNIASKLMSEKLMDRNQTSDQWKNDKVSVMNMLTAGMVHYGINVPLQQDYKSQFNELKSVVENSDISFFSQATLVGSDLPEIYASSVSETGFDSVFLANQYSLRKGKEGIEASLKAWQDVNIITSGTYVSTDTQNMLQIQNWEDISYIVLSFTDFIDQTIPEQQQYLVHLYDDVKTVQLVQKAAEQADVVIVSMYWQGMDGQAPTERQKEIAQSLADAGASVIVGNAPNAIQPVAWIDDTLIYYSLGNLLSDSGNKEEHFGAMGVITISKTTTEKQTKIELTNPRVDFSVTLDDANIYTSKLLRNVTSQQLSEVQEKMDYYSQVIQSLDDSIRIGGLE